MKNYVSSGVTVTLAVSALVVSGEFIKVGGLFGFAQTDAGAGEAFAIVTSGIFSDVTVASTNDLLIGDAVFYDGTVLTSAADDGSGGAYNKVGTVVSSGTSDGTSVTVTLKI